MLKNIKSRLILNKIFANLKMRVKIKILRNNIKYQQLLDIKKDDFENYISISKISYALKKYRY